MKLHPKFHGGPIDGADRKTFSMSVPDGKYPERIELPGGRFDGTHWVQPVYVRRGKGPHYDFDGYVKKLPASED